eukprot:GILK01006027.1.p1 GENE.GILK01006027.1~~GILK01006027.1.p1  ORF type:complete len:307 (-),score=40.10 GILK01006027.1:83-1003(-)
MDCCCSLHYVVLFVVAVITYKLFRYFTKPSISSYASYFQDKVVWITGASSGIGEELAYLLSNLGCKLIISARREDQLNRVKENCKGSVFVLPIDLSKLDTLQAKAKEALAKFGKIDILINNGGLSTRSWALDTQYDVDKYVMDVNFFSATILSKAVLPSMIKNGGGHLVAISSVSGKIGVPLRTAYCASKHALHGFFDALRSEVADKHVAVSLICPSYVKTNISVNAVLGDGKKFGKLDSNIAKGMDVTYAASEIIHALRQKTEELMLCGAFYKAATYAKVLCPSVLSWGLRRQVKKQISAMEAAK